MRYGLAVLGLLLACTDAATSGEADGGSAGGAGSATRTDGGVPALDAAPPGETDASRPDEDRRDASATTDAAGPAPAPGDASAPAITRTLPAADRLHTNGSVRLQFVVEADPGAQVEVRVDGDVIARVPAPYAYDLDTTSLDEGEVQVVGVLASAPSVASAPLSVVVDRTPPAIVARAPEPNAGSVWHRQPMGFSLSEPIVADTVGASAVRVSSGDLVIATEVSVSSDAREVAFVLQALPALPATLTVEVSDAITDLAGNALAADSWSFDMPRWAEAPAPDGDDRTGAFGFAVTEAGEQFVAWIDDAQQVQVARRTSGDWTLLPAFSDPAPADPEAVRLALSDAGHPVVGYLRETDALTAGGSPTLVRWDGSGWEELGSPAGTDGYAAPLLLQADPTTASLFVVASSASDATRSSWLVDDSGWTPVGGGGQSALARADGSKVVGSRVGDECVVSEIAPQSRSLGAISSNLGACAEIHLVEDHEGTLFAVVHIAGDVWRYMLGTHPTLPQPYWSSVPSPFDASDPEQVLVDAEGRMMLLGRGSTYAPGMVVVDWSDNHGQVIGNWLDAAGAELQFYAGDIPAVLRLKETTPSGASERTFDLVVALLNRI